MMPRARSSPKGGTRDEVVLVLEAVEIKKLPGQGP